MSEDIYERMTEKIMLKGSKIIPELFRMVVDENEAELMMAMPGTPEQLSQKVGRPAEEVERMCLELYHKGTSFKSFKGKTVGYKMCRDMIQFHDATILWPEATKDFHDLWLRFIEEEWPDFAKLYSQLLPKPFTRVVPVESAIDAGRQQILDADSAEKIVTSAEIVAVANCTCRVIAHKCDNPVEVCLQVDNAARYAVDRGTGREVSKEEAVKILKECEEAGLVHVTMNKEHAGHFICNCCRCCCQAFPVMIAEGLNICDPSRFVARIDPETCDDCCTCQDRCFFGALEETEVDGDRTVMAVVADKCLGCGVCHVTCPSGAITLAETRPADFIPS
ncbi:MAG: 4Fe-4S ferredoxin [Proteobacteria bacterium]|nr:4Fe-4S ferredoxin [Pseudomonadota bacterium]